LHELTVNCISKRAWESDASFPNGVQSGDREGLSLTAF